MVDWNIDRRWEQGRPHHERSLEVMEFINKVAESNLDYETTSYGGDGDPGEILLFYLDVYYETLDMEDN